MRKQLSQKSSHELTNQETDLFFHSWADSPASIRQSNHRHHHSSFSSPNRRCSFYQDLEHQDFRSTSPSAGRSDNSFCSLCEAEIAPHSAVWSWLCSVHMQLAINFWKPYRQSKQFKRPNRLREIKNWAKLSLANDRSFRKQLPAWLLVSKRDNKFHNWTHLQLRNHFQL